MVNELLPAYASKGSPERKTAALQIRNVIKIERGGLEEDYDTNRGRSDYLSALGGFSALGQYLATLKTRRILGIGEGTTRGINTLATSDLGRRFDFFATVLVPDPRIEQNLGRRRTFLTSAERMHLPGFDPQSAAAVLAIRSIAYSKAPKLVAYQIDKLLVPGGVVKASFASHYPDAKARAYNERTGFQTADTMAGILGSEEFGYDVFVHSDGVDSKLLAVKPRGQEPKGFAERLFMKDWDLFYGDW